MRYSLLLAGTCLLLPACQDGHVNFLGYSTEPNYDCTIRKVYVPIPQNVTYRRGLEFDLKRAIDREIETKTPFRVTSRREDADTELVCKIVMRAKNLINYNQLNETREAETTLGVEVNWLDLRAGHVGDVLCRPPGPQPDNPPPADPLAIPKPPPPILITVPASFFPELGGSLTSAEKQMVDRLAVQIVSMMENRW